MKDKILQYYNRMYQNSQKTKSIFGLPEKELMNFLNSFYLERAKVLDLGCGDGRNTIFLASKNFIVFGVDNSPHGLKKIKAAIKNTKIAKNIHLKKANLRRIKLRPDEFNLVVCTNTLHEIGADGVKHIIKQAKNSTKLLGINYLAFFIPKAGTHMRKGCYYPNPSAIIRQYKGWKILRIKTILMAHNTVIPHSKGKRVSHKHYVCHLFLQKLN